MIICKIINFIA